MFVFLSKFLPPLVYPVGLACILLGVALLLRRQRRWQTIVLLVTLAVLLVGGNRWVALSLVRSLEWQNLPQADPPTEAAIVVLGGGTDAQQYPRPDVEVNGAGDRVIYAARLYKQGKAAHILLSGGNITWLQTRASTPASEMANLLSLMDVPADALWIQDQSQNTHEDALYSSRMLKEKGISTVLLVTSAMHMPRSLALFRAQGIDAIPAPTDFSVTQADWDDLTRLDIRNQLINLVPTAGNLDATSGALKEYLGMIVYALRGWMAL